MVKFTSIPNAPYRYDYEDIFRSIARGKINGLQTYRELCKKDLFFVLYFGLERTDVNQQFIIKCIREVEEDHEDTLDLWAREHYKSTTLTYGLPIQELIIDPEERIGIFSHTRPIAKGFLRQIKHTLEEDVPVKRWFPEIFYKNPRQKAPKWSEDDGLIMQRKGRYKEASIEAWGLVDGQPTSKHFTIRIYDDVVTEASVTEGQIPKTLKAYEISQSLGTDGGTKRVNGTHYHFADLYAHLRKKATYKPRIKPATHNGMSTGKPVFLSPKRLAELRSEQGPYIFACQQLLKPVASEDQKFRLEWLRYYIELPRPRNKYLLVDPANEKHKGSDYTTMGVISIDCFRNYFLEDLIRERLSLGERWKALRDMWIRNPGIKQTGYEKYGKDADITYMEEKQEEEGVYFNITPLGGQVGQTDRILRLVPRFSDRKFYLPHRLIQNNQDMIKIFIDEEYSFFPFCAHNDMLDMISRIEDQDMDVTVPLGGEAAADPRADEKANEHDPFQRAINE